MSGGKYGLILPKGYQKPAPKPAAANPLFDFDDEPQTEVKDLKKVMLEAQKQASMRESQTQKEIQGILAEDPTAFDYDSVYDDLKSHTRAAKPQQQKQSAPLYIHNLLAKAEERKKQMDLVTEKKMQREAEAEKELFGDTEAFVTPAYKEKIAQNRAYEEEQKRKEAEEAKHEVTGKRDMSAFYSNLLTKNVSMGASTSDGVPASDSAATKPSASSAAHSSSSRRSRSPARDDRSRRRSRSRSRSRDRKYSHRGRSPRRRYSRSRSRSRDRYQRRREDPEQERRRQEEEEARKKVEEEARRRAEAEEKKYAKRTVGKVFDEARERCLLRKSLRGSHSSSKAAPSE